jgi:hypothetical protein
LNVSQAVVLRKHIEDMNYFPKIQILGNGQGYFLYIREDFVDGVNRKWLKQIAEENNLSLSLFQGYWLLRDLQKFV